MATIEDVNERTILQQFHSLYKKQNETETNVENLDAKIDQETINRQTADLSINSEIQTLKDQIDSLGVLFTYKGEVATIQDLPATNNKPGDVYYVDNEQSEYVWLEKSGVYQWEEFGPAIDLSEYAKQEDLQQLENSVNATNTKVERNTSNITSLTNTKQDKLTAGTNITIDENNVISASGGEKLYVHNISIINKKIDSFIFSVCFSFISKHNTAFRSLDQIRDLYSHHGSDTIIQATGKICLDTTAETPVYYDVVGITIPLGPNVFCNIHYIETSPNSLSINKTSSFNILIDNILTDSFYEIR